MHCSQITKCLIYFHISVIRREGAFLMRDNGSLLGIAGTTGNTGAWNIFPCTCEVTGTELTLDDSSTTGVDGATLAGSFVVTPGADSCTTPALMLGATMDDCTPIS